MTPQETFVMIGYVKFFVLMFSIFFIGFFTGIYYQYKNQGGEKNEQEFVSDFVRRKR